MRTIKKPRLSTLTIRIDAELKNEVLALAHEAGEDASTWIRRFFEQVRRTGKDPLSEDFAGDEGGEFSEAFIQGVVNARRKGSFKKFNLKDYV